MTDRAGLLDKENGAFAAKNRGDVRGSHLSAGQPTEMDGFLEDTLFNDVVISEPLTKREAEILRLIVSGKTNKKIARQLCRTERTVEYHRNRLMRKLDAHSAADLVRRAIAVGIV